MGSITFLFSARHDPRSSWQHLDNGRCIASSIQIQTKIKVSIDYNRSSLPTGLNSKPTMPTDSRRCGHNWWDFRCRRLLQQSNFKIQRRRTHSSCHTTATRIPVASNTPWYHTTWKLRLDLHCWQREYASRLPKVNTPIFQLISFGIHSNKLCSTGLAWKAHMTKEHQRQRFKNQISDGCSLSAHMVNWI